MLASTHIPLVIVAKRACVHKPSLSFKVADSGAASCVISSLGHAATTTVAVYSTNQFRGRFVSHIARFKLRVFTQFKGVVF